MMASDFAMNGGMQFDLQWLRLLGEALDSRPATLAGRSLCEFYIRVLLKIRDRNGRNVPLVANRAQHELEQDGNRRKVILKARQLGITTWVAARFFMRTITRPGTLTVQVAHDQQSAEEIFKIVHRFLENLPEALRSGALRTSRANVRQIVFPELDSEYRVETAADPNAGRGLTIQNLHCSEVARWPHPAAETLASLRAAVPAEGEIVMESTPRGTTGCFYEEWQRAEETGASRRFFPWWFEPAYKFDPEDSQRDPAAEKFLKNLDVLSVEEKQLASRLSLAQIAYRRFLQSSFRGLAAQEFCEDPSACFLASGECVFDLAQIEKRLESCRQQYCELRENGALCIWYPVASGRRYVVGVDPAGGGSAGDYSCAQVIDWTTGLQCAELRGHYPPQELARYITALAKEYNNALLVVERNNHGHGVLAHLAAVAPDANIYEHKGQAGWLTTAINRPPMIENFAVTLATAPNLFNSARLLEECRTFIRRENGVPAAAQGAHDDCVMAMAIALAARAEYIKPLSS